MRRFAHIATRLFNVPLIINPAKAEIVVAALADRLGVASIVRLDGQVITPKPMAYADDDDEIIVFEDGGRGERKGYDMAGGIARIEIEGTLVHKLGTLRPSSGMTGYDGIRENFVRAQHDDTVKGIVLEIDSPGGEVSGCFDLADTIFSFKGSKPVWAILNEAAFSGGYALACVADRIIVPRTGGTGSIGVVWMHCDFSQMLGKEGIRVTFIQRGDRKVDGAPEIPLSEEAMVIFQQQIDEIGGIFEALVAKGRGLSTDKIRGMNAATFQGAQSVALGLADAVMAPDAAYRAMFELVG